MKVQAVKFILWAQDMDRAVSFYRDVFGLQARLVTPHWSELAFWDAIVALHGGGTGEFQATGLGLQVDDAEAACRAVAEAGGTVRTPPRERPGEGIRLAEAVDPEGNGFTISERIG